MTAKEFNRCLDALPNDRNALEKIYNEYYLQLVYTALSMTKNREAAYDIASTVMLKLPATAERNGSTALRVF